MGNRAITINGLPLPSGLVRLIEAGQWTRPADTTALRELTGTSKSDFDFAGPEWMERETAGVRQLASSEFADGYGLASSRRLGRAIGDPSILDVDLAVLIAVNWDEEAIFLDYRPSLTRPAVAVSTWEKDGPNVHRRIAKDFDEFVGKIGLDSQR